MSPPPRLEICVDTSHAALNAFHGGAERLELCSSLADGGLTPSIGLVQNVLSNVSIPVHCMVRPRAGSFVYSQSELSTMLLDIAAFRAAKVPGVVLGILTEFNKVDTTALKSLVDTARPMKVVFHRAFDLVDDRGEALEELIRAGVDIVLTSGGAKSLAEGVDEVKKLVRMARGRIQIMGGAGVNRENAGGLWKAMEIDTIHASLRRPWPEASLAPKEGGAAMGKRDVDEVMSVREEDVRAVLECLDERHKERGTQSPNQEKQKHADFLEASRFLSRS